MISEHEAAGATWFSLFLHSSHVWQKSLFFDDVEFGFIYIYTYYTKLLFVAMSQHC